MRAEGRQPAEAALASERMRVQRLAAECAFVNLKGFLPFSYFFFSFSSFRERLGSAEAPRILALEDPSPPARGPPAAAYKLRHYVVVGSEREKEREKARALPVRAGFSHGEKLAFRARAAGRGAVKRGGGGGCSSRAAPDEIGRRARRPSDGFRDPGRYIGTRSIFRRSGGLARAEPSL